MIKDTYHLREAGYGLALGLPSEFCRALRLYKGSAVKITMEDDRIIITPVYDAETAKMIKHDKEFILKQEQMFETKETSHEQTVTAQEFK